MAICRICLADTREGADYHPTCVERLFGTRQVPVFNLDPGELYAAAAQLAGKMSISGMQAKVSLGLTEDRTRLEVMAAGGRYILKPEPTGYPALPQNEQVTMRLAAEVEIETPPNGLLQLKGGSWAYIIQRFDRLADGRKLQVEDFCQLAGLPAKDKYDGGTAERCIQLLQRFASEPLVEIRKFYRLLLFGWWVANGDMHLKNFSMLTLPDGQHQLAPAYDLVNTRLAISNDDTLALTMGGKARGLTRKSWLQFADYCGLPKRAAESLLTAQIEALGPSLDLLQRSFLPEDKKLEYQTIIRAHTALLQGDMSPLVTSA